MLNILAQTFRIATRTEPPRHPLNPKPRPTAKEARRV